MERLLEIKDLYVEYQTDDARVFAVNGINLKVGKGETLGLVGETGAGKTTTALSIMRLLPEKVGKIKGGTIILNGKDVTAATEADMRLLRGETVSMIFQDPMTSLNPTMRIGKQIEEVFVGRKGMSAAEKKAKALEILKMVGISDGERRYKQYPHELSGGMKQRVMIAIALVGSPSIVIADEPTTSLDVTIEAQILDVLKNLQKTLGTSIILITHDLGVVAEMCSRVVVMYAGRIVEEAPVQELFADPKHPYTQGLIGSVPKLGSGVESLPSIPGSVPDLSVMPKGCKFAPRCKYAMDICHQQEPELADINEAGTRKCRCHLLNKTGKEA